MTVMKVYIDHELVFDAEKEKRSVVEALNLVLFGGTGFGDGCSNGAQEAGQAIGEG